jgi:hypothetical protein
LTDATRSPRPLRFHWVLSSLGQSARRGPARVEIDVVPDLGSYAEFCRLAEGCGIESLLMPFGFHRPDPELAFFGEEILPRVRERERRRA